MTPEESSCRKIDVSIIMPAYNAELYIAEAIESVLRQTYTCWELLIIDDSSTDRTPEIVRSYAVGDGRIRYRKLDRNCGASAARNLAIGMASGKYLAFLDSDDIWLPEKLAVQVGFMEKNNVLFSCTSYRKIDEQGTDLGQAVTARKILDYEGVLKRCPGNSTVMYNAWALGRFTIPDIRKRNDYVLWLQVIKKAGFLFGIERSLGYYRVRCNSLSARKIPLVRYQWRVYRSIEKLPLGKSFRLLFFLIGRRLYHTARNFCRAAHTGTSPEGRGTL